MYQEPFKKWLVLKVLCISINSMNRQWEWGVTGNYKLDFDLISTSFLFPGKTESGKVSFSYI